MGDVEGPDPTPPQPIGPVHEEDDDDLGEIEVDLDDEDEEARKDYPWAAGDKDIMLRSFIFQTIVDSDDTIIPQVELMHECYIWIKTGDAPKGKAKAKHLKAIE